MKILGIALFGLLLVGGMSITLSQASLSSLGGAAVEKSPVTKPAIGGTIESVDPASLRVTILTDFGQKESLPVTKMSVLVGVIEGDRVWAELNEDGKVKKIVKTTPAPERSPASRGSS